jgi:putative ABC transport system substrate-binding protein
MRRRQFLALLGGMAIGCPAEVVAQKPDRVRRIGVLIPATASSALGLRRAKIFTQALQDLGWTDGQNTRIDYRWSGGDIEQIQSLAKELVGSRPDVLVGAGQAPTAALQQATRTIPIVFVMSVDPVAEGIVQSLARPGGNATDAIAHQIAVALLHNVTNAYANAKLDATVWRKASISARPCRSALRRRSALHQQRF